MRSYGKSRRQLFEELDRPSLRLLPQSEYAYAEWKKARESGLSRRACTSLLLVPHALVHQAVELRHTQDTVEIFSNESASPRIARALHGRWLTTRTEHMPRGHQAHQNRSPQL